MIYQVKFDITTDASGDYDSAASPPAGAKTGEHAKGPLLLYAVEWIVGGLDAGVDFTLSVTESVGGLDKTLIAVTTADNADWYQPQEVVHSATGAATDFFTPQVVEGTLRLVVADGGNAQSGTCIIYLLEV